MGIMGSFAGRVSENILNLDGGDGYIDRWG
jgi:hypothetical protein